MNIKQFNNLPITMISGVDQNANYDKFKSDFKFDLPNDWNDFEIWWDSKYQCPQFIMQNELNTIIKLFGYFDGCKFYKDNIYNTNTFIENNYKNKEVWITPELEKSDSGYKPYNNQNISVNIDLKLYFEEVKKLKYLYDIKMDLYFKFQKDCDLNIPDLYSFIIFSGTRRNLC